MKEDEIGSVRSMYVKEEECIQGLGGKAIMEKTIRKT
jgi:hypothetical protein